MARNARKKSRSGYYHVIIRGIGKQILFECAEDHRYFLAMMKRYLTEHAVRIHAYCMMENHVHLLLYDPQDELDVFMKKLEGSYAFYYNHRYERSGTLFQDRFKSEPIEDDAYYVVVLRYILQNPVKAGIDTVESYPWSSYRELTGGAETIQADFAIGLFGGKEELVSYVRRPNEDVCLEPSPVPISDTRAKLILRECLRTESGTQLQAMDREARDSALRTLKEKGLSVRQIERLTGINRGVILRA